MKSISIFFVLPLIFDRSFALVIRSLGISTLKSFPRRSLTILKAGENYEKIDDWSTLQVPQKDKPIGYVDDKTVQALTWALNADGTKNTPPEMNPTLPVGKWLSERKDIGIALSGGGLRAATLSLGWFVINVFLVFATSDEC